MTVAMKPMSANPDPRTLLLPDPDAIPSVLRDKFAPLCGSGIGLATIATHRYISKRPIWSGIHTYFIYGIGGLVIGKLIQDRRDNYNMDRDATMRHYIELHPEDFPVPERVKVGDVFKTFIPKR